VNDCLPTRKCKPKWDGRIFWNERESAEKLGQEMHDASKFEMLATLAVHVSVLCRWDLHALTSILGCFSNTLLNLMESNQLPMWSLVSLCLCLGTTSTYLCPLAHDSIPMFFFFSHLRICLIRTFKDVFDKSVMEFANYSNGSN